MKFLKECIICHKQFRPKGSQCKKCEPCQENIRIERLFKVYGKFKGCNTLEEALGKYGSKNQKVFS